MVACNLLLPCLVATSLPLPLVDDKKHPPAEPLGEMRYGKTFSAFQEFLCFGTILSELACKRKSRMFHGGCRQ